MILVHPERAGARVVVPVHAGRILKPKTLAVILKSAQIAEAGEPVPEEKIALQAITVTVAA